ncbi:MAG: GFA family protein [Halioglobus sp.]
MSNKFEPLTGGCTCGLVRYTVRAEPLIVHACHCRRCQNQSGGPHVINALLEADHIEQTSGELESLQVPTPSGKGQTIVRCSSCKVAIWSHYDFGGLGQHICFLRVGTLDRPDTCPPDVHIYTSTKLPWYLIHPSQRAVEEYYDTKTTWRPESMARLNALRNAVSN